MFYEDMSDNVHRYWLNGEKHGIACREGIPYSRDRDAFITVNMNAIAPYRGLYEEKVGDVYKALEVLSIEPEYCDALVAHGLARYIMAIVNRPGARK